MKKNQVKNKIIFIVFSFLLILVQSLAFASSTRVIGMHVVKNDNGVGVEIDLTANPRYQVFFVGGPPRVVIDLQNAMLATSVNRSSLANTPIANIRTGVHENGQLRIVLDLQKEMPFHYKFFADKSGKKSRLFISLGVVKQAAKKAVATPAVVTSSAAQVSPKPVLKRNLPQSKPLPPLQPQQKSQEQLTQSPTPVLAQPQVSAPPKAQPQSEAKPQSPQPKSQKQISIPIPIEQPVLPKAPPVVKTQLPQSQTKQQPQASQQKQAQPQPPQSSQPQVAEKQTQVKAQPQPQSQPSAPEQKPYSVSLLEPDVNQKPRDIVVVIDPGHGGKDPGASGLAKLKEKNVVLAIAKDIQRFLNQQSGFSVILTRDGDYHVGLRERLRIAHVNKADIFISLHADVYKNNFAKGTSVYALSQDGATSEAARWLAERENASELGAFASQSGNALRSVLIDVAQTASIKNSLVIADSILQQLSTVNKLHNKKVDQASFVVLKSPDIPSLLIETGFVSDPKEEKNLRDPEYQEKFAEALARGLVIYFSENPPSGTYLAAEKIKKKK